MVAYFVLILELFFSRKSNFFLWSEKRLLLVCLINISDFCSSMSASGSHRARKRIREAKKKARPGKQKIPPQKFQFSFFDFFAIYLNFWGKIRIFHRKKYQKIEFLCQKVVKLNSILKKKSQFFGEKYSKIFNFMTFFCRKFEFSR